MRCSERSIRCPACSAGHSMRHKPDGGVGGRPRRFSQDESTNPLKLTLPSPRASHRSPSPNPQASSSNSHGSPHRSISPHTTPMTPPQTPQSASPPILHHNSSRHPSPLQLQPQQLLLHQQHLTQHQPSPLSPRIKDSVNAFVVSDMIADNVVIPTSSLTTDISTTIASSISTPPAGTPPKDFLPSNSRLSASPVATPPPPSTFSLTTSDHSMEKLDAKSPSYGYGNQVTYYVTLKTHSVLYLMISHFFLAVR